MVSCVKELSWNLTFSPSVDVNGYISRFSNYSILYHLFTLTKWVRRSIYLFLSIYTVRHVTMPDISWLIYTRRNHRDIDLLDRPIDSKSHRYQIRIKVGISLLIAGYSYDPDCMYVNGTGRDYYEFYIQLNRCGTLGENTHHQDSRKNPTVC